MAEIVPLRWLSLFSHSELETLICGAPDIDLAMLKRHTIYEGYNSKSRVVQDFWSVMEEFSPSDRSLYLRFVSGRARLPLNDAGFDRSMKIQVLDRQNPDQYLPLSHTCFFSIEIPRYSSRQILKDRLLYAIRHCTAIDTDFTQSGEAGRHMEWRVPNVEELDSP
jgi:E3 ubiquitin-protein ligase HERC2